MKHNFKQSSHWTQCGQTCLLQVSSHRPTQPLYQLAKGLNCKCL